MWNFAGYNVNTKFTIPNVDDALNVLMRQREKALKVCQVDRGFHVITIRSNSVDRGKMPTLGWQLEKWGLILVSPSPSSSPFRNDFPSKWEWGIGNFGENVIPTLKASEAVTKKVEAETLTQMVDLEKDVAQLKVTLSSNKKKMVESKRDYDNLYKKVKTIACEVVLWTNLQTLQQLQFSGRPSKAPRILEFNWRPLPPGCFKVNMDGTAFGSPSHVGCTRVFRTCRGFVKGCFAIPLGVCFAFEIELATAVHAIDNAWTFGWRRLWLESDSTFVVTILRSRSRKTLKSFRSIEFNKVCTEIELFDIASEHILKARIGTRDSALKQARRGGFLETLSKSHRKDLMAVDKSLMRSESSQCVAGVWTQWLEENRR
ncbi:hypothetical protein Q3G72_020471 [Acer saccharum]|nr:hypothetical protein Q3G72_020471 [Acer saccharum]